MKRLIGLTVAGLLVISIFSSLGFANAQIRLRDISGHLFEFEINKLVEANIVRGFPDGTFRPEGLVTRGDMAVMIALGRRLTLERPAVSPFRDVPTAHHAYPHIVAARNAGFLRGFPDGTFRPAANVNRSELAAILGQAKGLAAEAAKITTPLVKAQDEVAIPKWAGSWVTLGVRPQHQYLTYRSVGGFSVIAPLAPATRGEVAYGIHQVINPPKIGGVVNIGMVTEPDTMNMMVGPTALAWVPWSLINIPTVVRNQDWSLYPGTLQEVPTVENGLWRVVGDRMEITYRLRQGLKWQDRKPVTINDWAYTFQVFMDPLIPSVRTLEEKIDLTKGVGAFNIKGFDILTPYSTRVYFKELDFRANLWMPGSMELTGFYPQHLLEGPYTEMRRLGDPGIFIRNEILSRRPIGLGPYRITEWVPGTRMVFERNPDFFLGPALLNNIVIRFVPDTTVLLARVISGRDVDITPAGIPLAQGLLLEARPPANVKVNFAGGLAFTHIAFNLDNPILSDLRVRQALIHSVDREAISQSLFQGRQPVAHTIFAPRHWASEDKNIIKYPFNQAEARRLLDEAGWRVGADGFRFKDGNRLTLELRTTAGHREREDVQLIVQRQLREVGVNLDITRNLASAIFLGREHFVMRRWPDMIMFSWGFGPTSIGDAVFREDMIPTPENNWTGWNIYGWRNSEATELLKRASMEMSEVRRKELLSRVQFLLTKDPPFIPLYFSVSVLTSKTNLASIKPVSLGRTFITWNSYNWYWR